MKIRSWRTAQVLTLLLVYLGLTWITPALAEGSRSLYPSGYSGSRANLDLEASQGRYANVVRRRTFLYVYARAGEYILLGSSNRGDGGDIKVYDPQSFGPPGDETIPGSADFSCASEPGTYSGGTYGEITSRDEELAGPNSADGTGTVTNGYTPCAYQAPETGIYGVLFTAANSGGGPKGSITNVRTVQ